MRTMLLASVLVLALAGPSSAQNVGVSKSGHAENMSKIPPKAGLNQQDRRFMSFAAASNMYEVMTSELAMQRASSPWAREFARDMVREHTAAQEELKALAKDKNISLPTSMPRDMRSKLRRLSSLQGSAFDRAYRDEQLKAHAKTAQMMERQIKQGRDSMVRNYAVKMLPGVRMHQQMAMQRVSMTGTTTKMGRKAMPPER